MGTGTVSATKDSPVPLNALATSCYIRPRLGVDAQSRHTYAWSSCKRWRLEVAAHTTKLTWFHVFLVIAP